MLTILPASVRAVLWSYDTSKMDLERDKTRIILETLNHGSIQAVDWLQANYTQQDLATVVQNSSTGEWTKKSLNYWMLVLNTKPTRVGRFA